MNRDNVLWGLAGVLVGFIAAWFLFESVGSRQPPRAVPGGGATDATVGGSPGAGPSASPEGGIRAPFLEQRVRQLEEETAANPDSAETWLTLANLRFDLQRWSAAAEAYERYLALAPATDPDVLTDLGLCYHMTGRPDEALAQFDRAQELAPDHWKSQFNEAFVLAFDLGRFDEAQRVIERLRELQPDNPDVERLAAEVSARRGAA